MHLGCSSCEWWVLWVLCPSDGLKRQLKIHLDLGGFSIAMFHYLPGIYHGHKPQLAYKVKGLGYYLRGGNDDSWAGYLGLSTIKVSRLVKVNHKIRFGILCMMNWEYTSHIIKGFWMMVIDVYDFFFGWSWWSSLFRCVSSLEWSNGVTQMPKLQHLKWRLAMPLGPDLF